MRKTQRKRMQTQVQDSVAGAESISMGGEDCKSSFATGSVRFLVCIVWFYDGGRPV
jgi:hypothetical protein